jgi:hypothetical protein
MPRSASVSNNGNFDLETILAFLDEHSAFSHQSKDIRELAKDISLILMELGGDTAVVPTLKKALRPKQLQEYEDAWQEKQKTKRAVVPLSSRQDISMEEEDEEDGGGASLQWSTTERIAKPHESPLPLRASPSTQTMKSKTATEVTTTHVETRRRSSIDGRILS